MILLKLETEEMHKTLLVKTIFFFYFYKEIMHQISCFRLVLFSLCVFSLSPFLPLQKQCFWEKDVGRTRELFFKNNIITNIKDKIILSSSCYNFKIENETKLLPKIKLILSARRSWHFKYLQI